MASRYWVGGSGTWDASSTAHWAATSNGAAGASAPTASDNAFIDVSSGAGGTVITISAAVCLSLDMSGNLGVTLAFGSSSLSLGGLRLGSNSVITTGAAGVMNFVGTSLSGLITTAGKTLPNVVFNGSASTWTLQDAMTAGAVTLTQGTLDTNGKTCTWTSFTSSNTNTRTLTLGASVVQVTGTVVPNWNCLVTTNMTLNAGTSYVGMAATTNGVVYPGAALTYYRFARYGPAVQNDYFTLGTNLTCNTLDVVGNSVLNRCTLSSAERGTPITVTVTGTWIASNCDFRDITGAGAASRNLSAVTGLSGDKGGNSGFTFTTSATQTWQGTTSGSWSNSAKWTSRVPLAQDDVVIASAFSASQTVTMDRESMGRSITWTGTTGSPAWTWTVAGEYYGSLTMAAGVGTISGMTASCAARGAVTITCAGKSLGTWYNYGPGNTVTCLDAFTSSSFIWTIQGTFDANDQNVTATSVVGYSYGLPYSNHYVMGSGTWSLTDTAAGGAPWNAVAGYCTIDCETSTIVYSTATANARLFSGAGFTYNVLSYIVAGSTGMLTIVDSNSFAEINFSDASNARTLRLTAGTTQTIRNNLGLKITGTSGKLMTLDTTAAGSPATIALGAGKRIEVTYASIKDSTGPGVRQAFAYNSTNVSGNTGWTFVTVVVGTDTETGSGSDASSSTQTLAGEETGAGVDASSLAATLTGADTGAGVDASAVVLTAAAAETGTSSETGSIAATLTGADTAAGADASSLTNVLADVDTGSSAETGALTAAAAGAETGSGVDAGAATVTFADADVAPGADAGSLLATFTSADTGAGVDVGAATVTFADSDVAPGVDAGSILAALADVETGASAEGSSLVVDTSDQDIADADTGSGSETSSLTATAADTETGSGSETSAIAAVLAGAETAAGLDAGSLAAQLADVETGSSSEASFVVRPLTDSDVAAGTDTGTLSAVLSATEAGSGVETAGIASSATDGDLGASGDLAALVASLSTADTGSGSDNGTPTNVLSAGETGAGLDAGSVAATLAAIETGLLAEGGALAAALADFEAAAGVDASALVSFADVPPFCLHARLDDGWQASIDDGWVAVLDAPRWTAGIGRCD